jgi:ubiquinone/menaquinone biosynthesis C-methylase UbiE
VTDRWAEWLRVRRTGGSAEERRTTLERLASVRDRILDDAQLQPGDVLLDVGCGDGLVGLGALDRGARVIFGDISEELLEDCRAVAGDEAEYRVLDASDLGDVEADVVTTRSVLIYVDDKARAFAEFFRVLRPAGRLSIFEPINRFGAEQRVRTYGFADVDGVEHLLARVIEAASRGEEEAGGLTSMIDFDERDLLVLAEAAGFVDIRLTLLAEITTEPVFQTRDWGVFLASSPNPLAPTFGEAMGAALSPEEAQRLATVLRPQIEGSRGTTRMARAFLNARRPA